MGLRFTDFDTMTKQNKITALMQLLKIEDKKQDDYLLALHALTDENMSVYLAAKRVIKIFCDENYIISLSGLSRDEVRKTVLEYMAKNIILTPHLIEIESHAGDSMLSKELQVKQGTYEATGKWIGPFAANLWLLNALRDDTQSLIHQLVESDEKLERAYICFYDINLADIRKGKKSLDTTGAAFKSELGHVRSPGDISSTLGSLFMLTHAPSYLLFLLSNKRGYMFLREELRETKASVFSFNLTYASKIDISEQGELATLEIDTPYDILKLPYLKSDDAEDAMKFINLANENSKSKDDNKHLAPKDVIETTETPLDKELKKLDLLLSSKYMNGKTFLSHKFEQQYQELQNLVIEGDSILSGGLIGEEPKKKIVIFMDIIGFTGGPAEKHPLRSSTLKPVYDKIILPIVKKENGYIVQKSGGSLIVLFDTWSSAYDVSETIFTKLNRFNRSRGEKVFARIFINRESVESRGGRIFGKAINIAVRMASLAIFGRVSVAKELVSDVESFAYIGSYSIPGYNEKLDLFYAISIGNEMINLSTLYLNALKLNVGPRVPEGSKVLDPPRKVFEKLEAIIATYKKALRMGVPPDYKSEKLLVHLRKLMEHY